MTPTTHTTRASRRAFAALTGLALCLLAMGCADDPVALPPPDRASFDAVVYPILLQDCGFVACHGAPDRFFHVFGPGRARLDPNMEIFAGPTEEELSRSYTRTIAMLDAESRESATLLLMKPLDPEAGGAGHKGADHYGRDVYSSVQHPRYVQLRQWALSRAGGVR